MGENGHKVVELPSSLTVRHLAELIKVSPIDVIKQLMANGVMANINQQIDFDTAAVITQEMGYEAHLEQKEEKTAPSPEQTPAWRLAVEHEDPAQLSSRPPVVTILGHVDHGKTSLLDAVRKTHVAEGEAGGITQHIGAYQIVHKGRPITFLDTPGHAAFTAMRARGAQVTDIAILVVAADDGVMPQTREAYAHAKAAGVPIVVALNKIDKPNANPERVKQQLADLGLTPDEWGGETMVVPVSAKKNQGIDDLLEAIVLTAESTKIQANPKGRVVGSVIEAQLDKSKGPEATLLVQNGTLHVGDLLVAGRVSGRIRAMFDFRGQPIEQAGPSTPVSVLGLSDLPEAGDLFGTVASEREARSIVSSRRTEALGTQAQTQRPISLEQVFAKFQAGEVHELTLILKADVQGSLEPIINSLKGLGTPDLKVNILYAETGNITENDVMLASASKAIVIGFNVNVDHAALRAAETERVSIRRYDVIYRLTEDVEKALKGLLGPEIREVSIGRAEVRAVFAISHLGKIAGCSVREGELRRSAFVRVWRGTNKLFEGEVASLKHEKDDVREVRQGFECGVGLKGFEDFQVGDILEFHIKETV
ncbi:MAG: translation initiation factor IF-2 [Anaerolineales bacterium]|jgi:translation initiation factor IF-2